MLRVEALPIEQAAQGKLIAQIKAFQDDIWVSNERQGMKVPAGSEVAKAILASPVLGAALKGLIAGAV